MFEEFDGVTNSRPDTGEGGGPVAEIAGAAAEQAATDVVVGALRSHPVDAVSAGAKVLDASRGSPRSEAAETDEAVPASAVGLRPPLVGSSLASKLTRKPWATDMLTLQRMSWDRCRFQLNIEPPPRPLTEETSCPDRSRPHRAE